MSATITTEGVEAPLIDVTVSLYVTRGELGRLGQWLNSEGFDESVDIAEWLEATTEKPQSAEDAHRIAEAARRFGPGGSGRPYGA